MPEFNHQLTTLTFPIYKVPPAFFIRFLNSLHTKDTQYSFRLYNYMVNHYFYLSMQTV